MDFSSLNPNTSNALSLAVRNNDVQNVQRLLKKMNPSCIDNRGWTCLHEAAANDSYQSLLLILNHRDCRPLAETHEGHTALYLACRHVSSIQTIKALLNSAYDIANYGSTESVTPLHIACTQGRLELIQLLIEYGAILDVQDFDGDTPLHDAALAMEHEAAATLLHAGANPEIMNDPHYTPFHLACYKGCYKTIKAIFPFVIDVNQVTINGDSPLILAIQGCNEDVIQFLLKNGADPHIKNIYGDMALNTALHMGYSGITRLLLSATDKDKINRDIVLHACKPHLFKLEILEDILNYNLGPAFFDFVEPFHVILEEIGGIAPKYLSNAPLNSYLNICEYIYENSKDKFREFFYAFLMRGISVNALDINECPPLVYVHYSGHSLCFVHVFEILREHGCNVDYCSDLSCTNKEKCIPDAFIASLTSDPATASIMLQHSIICEPEQILQFANNSGVLSRMSTSVQTQLLTMIDRRMEGVTVDSLPYNVRSLKHLSRLKIRKLIRNRRGGVKSTDHFFRIIERLPLPLLIIRYLRYDYC